MIIFSFSGENKKGTGASAPAPLGVLEVNNQNYFMKYWYTKYPIIPATTMAMAPIVKLKVELTVQLFNGPCLLPVAVWLLFSFSMLIVFKNKRSVCSSAPR